MKRFISIMMACIMLAMPFTFATAALACEDCEDNDMYRIDTYQMRTVDNETTLAAMESYLQTQSSTTNLNIETRMGCRFAYEAIKLRGNSYSTMDCSKTVHNALRASYSAIGLSSCYPFGSRKNSQAQYNDCVSFGLANTLSSSNLSSLKTGDLVFWCNPSTGAVNHVGIFFKYSGSNYVIESRSSAGGVVVSDIWSNSSYSYKAYARLNTAYTATFKTGSPFNGSLGTQKVLFNCPPSPPTPPTYTGYVFTEWTPSITAGITANTTYTANYQAYAVRSIEND